MHWNKIPHRKARKRGIFDECLPTPILIVSQVEIVGLAHPPLPREKKESWSGNVRIFELGFKRKSGGDFPW